MVSNKKKWGNDLIKMDLLEKQIQPFYHIVVVPTWASGQIEEELKHEKH